jgi:feruloyl esterase
LPAFCRVEATLTPSDDSAIKIEIWLPADNWNGKFQAVGNRGWGGSIMSPALAAAVAAGYASASTDTGHSGPGARFALGHPEKLIDAGYRAAHEMTVHAKTIVEAYYGRAARLAYWNGCSLGGRQGLSEAQRYPADYDGIVVGDAAHDVPHLYTGRMAVARALHDATPAGIPPAKFPVIHSAALNACDALDGVTDGVIGNPQLCRFDPGVLVCKNGGGANGDGCLTAAQVQSVRTMYAPVVDPRTRTVLFPGLETGSELGWTALASPQPENNALDMMKFIVFRDAGWDWTTFDLSRTLDAVDRTPNIDALNAVDPDLRPFFARGGKVLMYHGWADPQTPPQNSITYHDRVTATAGGKVAEASLRLFMVPGMGHCEGGAGTDMFEKVEPLDAWVEKQQPPEQIIAARVEEGRVGRTRPLCAYPKVARWNRRRDTNDAANFTCVAP